MPAPLLAGFTTQLKIRVCNTGVDHWPSSGDQRILVSYHWLDVQRRCIVWDGLRTAIDIGLAPQEAAGLLARVQLPQQAGCYTLQLTLLQENVCWFEKGGALIPLELRTRIVDPLLFASGELRALAAVTRYPAGMSTRFPVRLRNTGAHVWPSRSTHPLRLSYRFKHPGGSPAIRNGIRMPLPRDLLPQDSITLGLRVDFPVQAGDYILEVTAVLEQVAWLHDITTFNNTRMPVQVVDPKTLDSADRLRCERELTLLALETQRLHYAQWILDYDRLDLRETDEAMKILAGWHGRPVFSLLLVADGPSADQLQDSIESICRQIYPDWRLNILGHVSVPIEVRDIAQEYSDLDQRISCTFITGAYDVLSEYAFADESGDFSLLVRQGDRLAGHALFLVAGEILIHPEVKWLYFDSDGIDGDQCRHSPHFRCDPNPDLFLSLPYMSEHAVFATGLCRDAGGYRQGYEGAETYDLGLRILQYLPLDQIRHIPHVLYHSRLRQEGEIDYLHEDPGLQHAHIKAIEDHLLRTGISAGVRKNHGRPGYRIRYPLPDQPPLVTIIIPTRDRMELLRPCIGTLVDMTDYPRYDILVVDNQSSEAASRRYLDFLQDTGTAEVIPYDAPFNYSAMCNFAVRHARGELICLLNNDVQILHEGWLREMVGHGMRPEIGAVGASLWYADNTQQHAGVILGMGPGKVAAHAFTGQPRHPVRHYRQAVSQDYSAVTGACLLTRREVYRVVDGMNEDYLQVGYNDVDYCLKVGRDLGLRTLWTPFAELFHLESASRRQRNPSRILRHIREANYFSLSWRPLLQDDPAFSPNLNLLQQDFSIADPPRAQIKKTLQAYEHPEPVKLAFVHIPRTAGTSLRVALEKDYPGRRMLVVGPKEMALAYDRDARVLREIRKRARYAGVALSHFSHGFGDLIGVSFLYASFLRDPLERVVSHYNHLVELEISPLYDSPWARMSLEEMLRKQVIPPNLMTQKIAGASPEPVSWARIERGGRAFGAGFIGFHLPPDAWDAQAGNAALLEDRPADTDDALLQTALRNMSKDFLFVGRIEQFERDMATLQRLMGWEAATAPSRINTGSGLSLDSLDSSTQDLIRDYNRLDMRLYEYVSAQEQGHFYNAALAQDLPGARHAGH